MAQAGLKGRKKEGRKGDKKVVAKISLIIPVYNKAPFLNRCLDSVWRQNCDFVQVIVIDDGSTDGSSEICDNYGFETYHLTHRGVSMARNYGLSVATGEYVGFLDADDFLAEDAFKTMLKAIKTHHNIYQFGQYRLRSMEVFDERLVLPYYSLEGHYGIGAIPRYWVHVWNKLYKREFLQRGEDSIRFKDGMQFGEDALFNMECILANNGFFHAKGATVYHVLDDKNSLCRGDSLNLEKIELLDDEMCKLYDRETLPAKKRWILQAINQHRHSKLYRKFGFNKGFKGTYDVVYLVKEAPKNPELVYSLRSLEENWQYKSVWFCGGCPEDLRPDRRMKIQQVGLNKWEKVANMIRSVCKNDEITENFWLFNDDFFILKNVPENMPPQYNGELLQYILRIEKKQGGLDGFTTRLRQTFNELTKYNLTTLNYEVHKPMLLNRKKVLEVLEKFPNAPGIRSLYGNYWRIGGVDKHDMKVKIKDFKNIENIKNFWEFVSTSDSSFLEGNVGEFVREKFKEKSRFERSIDE